MFENAGEKLRVLGLISFILGLIVSVILGINIIKQSVLWGILVIAAGVFLSWLSNITNMAIAEAAIYAKKTYEYQVKMNYSNGGNATTNNLGNNIPNYIVKRNNNNGRRWFCSCGEANSSTDLYCKSCGKYK